MAGLRAFSIVFMGFPPSSWPRQPQKPPKGPLSLGPGGPLEGDCMPFGSIVGLGC